ncbi:MAG: ZIP family metal transporter, partial [Armatimonadota bacterium]|nr:ZIP family metal transporter [Armatimonadota bacterium]
LTLIPEVIEERKGLDSASALLILAGVVVFFLLESGVRHWQGVRGCSHPHPFHTSPCRLPAGEGVSTHSHTLLQARPFAVVNLGGDLAHNFIDGIAIGAAFLADTHLGVATTLAVVLHEIPQELGDFAVLLQAGLSRSRALLYNFLTALSSVAGGVVALLVGEVSQVVPLYLIPFTAGTFIYLAVGDLIPELQAHAQGRQSLYGAAGLVAGALIMFLVQLAYRAH